MVETADSCQAGEVKSGSASAGTTPSSLLEQLRGSLGADFDVDNLTVFRCTSASCILSQVWEWKEWPRGMFPESCLFSFFHVIGIFKIDVETCCTFFFLSWYFLIEWSPWDEYVWGNGLSYMGVVTKFRLHSAVYILRSIFYLFFMNHASLQNLGTP